MLRRPNVDPGLYTLGGASGQLPCESHYGCSEHSCYDLLEMQSKGYFARLKSELEFERETLLKGMRQRFDREQAILDLQAQFNRE